MSIILGIDPGSRVCGYGLVRVSGNKLDYIGSGLIKTASLPFNERLHIIYSDIHDIIAENKPDQAAVEEVFMGKNASSALKLGQARGAAIVACMVNGLDVHEYSARKVKQAVVGKGGADKKQVQHMIKSVLGLSSAPPEDAADALAVAVCHANMENTLGRMVGVKSSRRGRLVAK